MAENVTAYYIDVVPSSILFVSATEPLLKKWLEKRFEPLLDSYNLRDRIFAQSENKKSRKTGDTTFSKLFVGGSLYMASANSAASLRSDTSRILLLDEIDGAPKLVSTGEGSFIDLAMKRTAAWGRRSKHFLFSTPRMEGESAINEEYKVGDQRNFFVPCPHCQKEQVLEFGSAKTIHGLKPEMKAGELVDAYYICEHCHEAIFNYDKPKFMPMGRWRPTAKSSSKYIRSYYLNALYSPVGMYSWHQLYETYQKALQEPSRMPSFVNLDLGLPYKETGTRPKLEKIIELRCDYKSGSIPDGVLYLTGAIDVQRGESQNPKYPQRLEMEIMGHGLGYRTWSILHHVFIGTVDDPYRGAWAQLTDFAKDSKLKFLRSDGIVFLPKIMLIDAKDGNFRSTVYNFCDQWANTHAAMGFSVLKKRKNEKIDMVLQNNFKRYRIAKLAGNRTIIEFSGPYYKTHLYRNLQIQKSAMRQQPPGFCSYPADYPEKYFRQLNSEERLKDGSFYLPTGRHNEALDLQVMNLCAGDIYLDNILKDYKDRAKTNGLPQSTLDKINHRYMLDILAEETKRRPLAESSV
jgi:phage terminase large subunit GpA-like protein